MPKETKRKKRPTDVMVNAVRVMQIATSEIAEDEVESGQPRKGRPEGWTGGSSRAQRTKRIEYRATCCEGEME